MSVSHRMPAAMAAIAASCLFIGTFAGAPAKNTPLPRYEKRSVLVCDDKAFAEVRRQAIQASSCPAD